MALKKTAKAEDKKATAYNVEVKRAHELDNGTIMFDMEVNGVMIYGCSYKVLTRKDNGEEFAKIGFPSKKGADDKWYNQVYFKVDEEIVAAIEKGIEAVV